ncbi:MAG: hypothetical protein O3B07_06795, partial [Verrucomicrobia bacterium]|nr:hypothetical protein [Verrucomicrobiota bacterium]
PSSGSVASWNDKSGNNHHATQLNNASKPTLTPNSISGISALNFDGADSLSADTRFELGANPDIIVFAVVNDRTNVADGRIFLLGGSSLSLSCGTGSDGWAWRFDGGNEMYSSQSFDSSNLVVWQRTADSNIADSKFYLNGTEQASSGDSNPTSSPTSTTNKFVIGANSGANGNFFSGSIGEILILTSDSSTERIDIEGYLAHKWGLTSNLDPSHPSSVLSLSETQIKTSVDRDVTIGGSLSGENFSGTLDEIKIYDRGLSAAEVGTLFLDGTVKFTTTTTRQPPVVELYDALPDSNDSVVLLGELTNVDQENPIVTIYYGSSDGGLSADNWENNITINGGNPLPAGQFQATIDGLSPGERYYFRAYAVSTDGADWSTGEPEIKEDLLALWRLDEDSGNVAIDSVVPLRNAQINGQDANQTRTQGHSGNALKFDGGDDWMNLDSNDTGYLGEPFEGRTFMAWMKISPNLYAGPAITEYGALAAHFPFNLGFGKTAYDSNYDQLEGSLLGDTNWASGRFDESVIFSTDADHIRIPATDSLSNLHDGSFSLSLWVNPDQIEEKYTHGRLNAYSFELEKSDYYFNGIENLLSLSPSFSSILEDEETIDLDSFSPEDVPGLLIWMDASHADSFDINQSNNSVLEWSNRVVGQGYDFDLVWGDPSRKFTSGKWTVNFDGDDMLGTTSDLHHSAYKNYTAFSISRQTGGDNERLISSAHNWSMGYLWGGNNKFHFNGLLHNGSDPSDTNWHLHAVKLNYDQGSTWKDLVPGAINGSGASDNYPNPGQIRFGGWRNLEETSKGEVSAFLFYDRALSDSDLLGLQYYLANKWNMTDQLQFDFNRKVKLSSHDDFRTLGLTSQSNYQNSLTLFTGTFHAKETGFYQWELLNTSEQSALWIDQNQNGFFETGERLLHYAGEGLNNLVLDSIDLNEGNYSFAIYHAVGSGTPSVEVRFSTPSSNSGPPSLTTIHPSGPNQNDLFSTPIRSTLLRRGPLQLGINGDGTVFFKFVTLGNIVTMESDQIIPADQWSHIGVSVNEENSTLQLFINGSMVTSTEIPTGTAADLSDHLYWTLGGEHPIEKDYFYGKMDDLRFYANSLSEDQMLAISNDDITGQPTVGFRKQVIYDEGSATNGFSLVNDEGTLRALVIENETAIEVRTTRLIENTANDLPFTPLQKDDWDLSLWLDAADLTSMDQGSSPGAVGPPGNGASVGFWQDKSGSGHHAVKVSGNPQYQVQSFNNSFPCIEPNGGYFEISNSATEMDQLSAFTFVTAFKWTNTHTGDKLMYKGATGWHRNFATFYIGKFNTGAGQGTGFWVAENGTRGKMDGNSNTDARDQSKIFVIKYDGSGPNATFYINGDQERFHNMNPAWTQLPPTPSDSIHVGGNYQIAELLFFEKALGDDDRKKIEGYVAHKTGLNGDLFYTHPYFLNPPPGSSELKKANEIDTNWHHVAVSYGENPKTLKLYLDGQLADEPVVSTASGLIPSHPDIPSVGAPQGSFYLPDFGSFLGTLDDIRVYDRGLSASEIAQVFAGDANQTGLVEYRVVEKPQIQTLPAMEARPDSVILRANLSSIGGEIIESEVTLGENFDQDTIPGIQAWFDADQIDAQNGASLTKWQDQSGRPSQDRSFTNAQGSPRLLSFALKGNPVVSFDGEDDLMWTGYDFNSLLHQTGYTMVTLARFSGGENNRVITSRNNDFYFGFHADGVGLWRAGGNISPFGDRPDSQWHLHLGTISDNTGDPRASFWQDGILKVQDSLASDNQNFGPGQLQVGGVGTNYSSCEIAEILIYSQELNSYHRSILEGYLAHKWNLVDEVLPSTHPYRDLDPFGLQVSQTTSVSVGGDPAEVIIFWGDE